jgi:dUTP pyrophosphatase
MTKPKPPRGVPVKVRRLVHAEGLPLPAYQSEGAAGLDLMAAVAENTPLLLAPRARAAVPTGLALELPASMEGQVRPRSGLALRDGLTVLNAPGTIDSDYRGEVKVILVNLGEAPVMIRRGDRIAQLVLAPVTRARLEIAVTLGDTERGAGGFGSTGVAEGGRTPVKKSRKVAAVPRARKTNPQPAARTWTARRK